MTERMSIGSSEWVSSKHPQCSPSMESVAVSDDGIEIEKPLPIIRERGRERKRETCNRNGSKGIRPATDACGSLERR